MKIPRSRKAGMHTGSVGSEFRRDLVGKRNRGAAAVLAAAFGALTPFCSCSTIPILAGMLGAGVPFGAASAFLIVSPLLNPVIVTMIVTILGPATAGVYTARVFPLTVASGLLWKCAALPADVKRVRVVRDEGDGNGSLRRVGPLAAALAFPLSLFREVLPYSPPPHFKSKTVGRKLCEPEKRPYTWHKAAQ